MKLKDSEVVVDMIENENIEKEKLPEGWKKVRLGGLLKYEQPQKYIVKSEKYDERSGIPVLTPGKSLILGYTDEEDGIYRDIPVIIFDDFTTDSRYINFNFKLKSSAIKILSTFKDNVNLFFMFNLMQILQFKPGSEHKRFWISEFSKLQIQIPPLPEQCKIAEILGTVDNVIEKTAKIIEKYKRIKQGLMQNLLTRGIDENGQIRREKTHKFKDSPLGRIPEEWEVVKFEEMGELTSSRRVYFNEYTEDGIPFYRSKEIIEKTKGLDIENALFIPESKYKLIKKNYGVPKAGDVLITAVGTLGIIYIVKDTDGDFYFKDGNLLWLKGLNRLFIDKKFLFYIFRLAFEKQKEDIIIGTSQNALTIEKMKNLLIFYPPLSEQHRIASILSQIDETIEKEQKYKEKLERIKQGLMEDLLTGKVRVNNLIDEAKYVSQT